MFITSLRRGLRDRERRAGDEERERS